MLNIRSFEILNLIAAGEAISQCDCVLTENVLQSVRETRPTSTWHGDIVVSEPIAIRLRYSSFNTHHTYTTHRIPSSSFCCRLWNQIDCVQSFRFQITNRVVTKAIPNETGSLVDKNIYERTVGADSFFVFCQFDNYLVFILSNIILALRALLINPYIAKIVYIL